MERDPSVYVPGYKHLAPPERKQIQLLHFQIESNRLVWLLIDSRIHDNGVHDDNK